MWDRSKLKNPIKLQEYRRALYAKLSKQTQNRDVEQGWEQIKMTINEAANEIIQKKRKNRRNEWWDEDCRLAIRRKNEARRKLLQHRTGASNEWYRKERNEAN
jgi:hypothetical protein